jgi:hypothetical protein
MQGNIEIINLDEMKSIALQYFMRQTYAGKV